MSLSWTWGRECKLGWGWNQDLDVLIPVQGEPPNITSEVKNEWDYSTWNVSSTDIECWVSVLFTR